MLQMYTLESSYLSASGSRKGVGEESSVRPKLSILYSFKTLINFILEQEGPRFLDPRIAYNRCVARIQSLLLLLAAPHLAWR
jgi:hypothetical protein